MKGFIRKAICLILIGLLGLPACSPSNPLPQPRRVFDPSSVNGSMRTDDWDIAAVRYKYYGQGLDYSKSDLEPVFLVFKNKSDKTPRVLREEVYGGTVNGTEFMAYTVDEALRLVMASQTFKQVAGDALRSGALGAALGAGLGLLTAVLMGKDPGEGAALGGVIGGGVFATKTAVESNQQIERVAREELSQYAWTEKDLPPRMTKMGYVYMPGNQHLDRIKLTVRAGNEIKTYEMPILDSPEAAPSGK